MKIVFLSPTGQLGGAEVSLLDVLGSLREAAPDWQLHLIAAGEGPLAAKAAAIGVQTCVLPFPSALARLGDASVSGLTGRQVAPQELISKLLLASPHAIRYVKRLRRALHDLDPDVVHTNGFKMHVLGVWSCPHDVPLVWHMHDYLKQRPVMSRLLRRYARRCAAVIVNSKSVADDFRSVCSKSACVFPIHNAVDLRRFKPDGGKLDLDVLADLPPAEEGTVRIGLLGTLARWKGHESFLKALSILPDYLPIRAYIIGAALYQTDGSQYCLEELRSLAHKLGISHKVGFTGFVEDPAAALRSLDVVVHASTQPEPFGLVILEAMACGRAVIASQGGGAAEIFTEGFDALGHPPGDSAFLAEQISQLVESVDLRARLGIAARATAELRFNRTRLAAELMPIFQGAFLKVR